MNAMSQSLTSKSFSYSIGKALELGDLKLAKWIDEGYRRQFEKTRSPVDLRPVLVAVEPVLERMREFEEAHGEGACLYLEHPYVVKSMRSEIARPYGQSLVDAAYRVRELGLSAPHRAAA